MCLSTNSILTSGHYQLKKKKKKTDPWTFMKVNMNELSCCLTPAGWQAGHQSSPCSERLSCCSAQTQAESGTGWAETGCVRHFLSGSDQTGWWRWSDLTACFRESSSAGHILQKKEQNRRSKWVYNFTLTVLSMHTEDTIAKTLSLLGKYNSPRVFMLFICKHTLFFSAEKFGKI